MSSYHTNPEYRRRQLELVKRNHKRNSRSITYRQLVRTRKQIYNVRESIDVYMRRVETFELELIRLMQEKERLAVKWKNYKEAQKHRRVK